MFEDQTESMIKQRMVSLAPSGVNAGEGDFLNDAVSPSAIELAMAYIALDEALKVGFAETSYGQYLENIAKENGVERNAATKGKGGIEVTMTPGSVFDTGKVLATKEGNVRFTATESKTIGATGKETIVFENETAGNLGSIPAGTVFIAPDAIPGFLSAVNTETINAGTDPETDDDLRQRYFQKVRTPATSGNASQYCNWAKERAGVGDVKVIPLWNGPNTVKLVVIDANKQPASDSLVNDIQDDIDPGASGLGVGKAPIGAKCTVVKAEGVAINVAAQISGASPAAVQPLFEEALEQYLAGIAFKSTAVSYAKVGSLLLDSIVESGGTDYIGLTVNSGTANITLGNEQVAVKGTVTLT